MNSGVDFVVTLLSWFVMNNVNLKLWQMHVVNFDMDLWWILEWISVSVEPVHKHRMVNLGVDFGVCWGAGGGSDALAAPSRSRAKQGCWAPRHTHIESRLPLFPAGSCICKSNMKNKKKPRLRKSTKVFTLPHALDETTRHRLGEAFEGRVRELLASSRVPGHEVHVLVEERGIATVVVSGEVLHVDAH